MIFFDVKPTLRSAAKFYKTPSAYKLPNYVSSSLSLTKNRVPAWGFVYQKVNRSKFLLKKLRYTTSSIFTYWSSTSPFITFFLFFWHQLFSVLHDYDFNKTLFKTNSQLLLPFTRLLNPLSRTSNLSITHSTTTKFHNNFLVFLTYQFKSENPKNRSSTDYTTLRTMKILKAVNRNISLTLLSKRFFDSKEFRYRIQRFARKSKLGATVPRFFNFVLEGKREFYSPYTSASGVFTGLPKTTLLTPSYLLVSSSPQLFKTTQWDNLYRRVKYVDELQLPDPVILKPKLSVKPRFSKREETTKFIKKITLMSLNFNLDALAASYNNNREIQKLRSYSVGCRQNLTYLNLLTQRFLKRYKKSPHLLSQFFKKTKKASMFRKSDLSKRLFGLLERQLLTAGTVFNEHLIIRRLNKLIYAKLIQLQPAKRKFALEKFKRTSKKLLSKTSLIKINRAKLKYRFILLQTELGFTKQLSELLITTKGISVRSSKGLKRILRRRTSLFRRKSFRVSRKKMKKVLNLIYDRERYLNERFFSSIIKSERFSPLLTSLSQKKQPRVTLNYKSFVRTPRTTIKQAIKPNLSSLKKVMRDNLVTLKKKPDLVKSESYLGIKRVSSLLNLTKTHNTLKHRLALPKREELSNSNFTTPQLISNFSSRTRINLRNSSTLEQRNSSLFTRWGSLNYDYTLWLKKVLKLSKVRKVHYNPLQYRKSYLLRLRYALTKLLHGKINLKKSSLDHKVLGKSSLFLNRRYFFKKSFVYNRFHKSSNWKLSLNHHKSYLSRPRDSSSNNLSSVYKSFFQSVGTLKLRRRRALKSSLRRSVIKSYLSKSSSNSVLYRLRSKSSRKPNHRSTPSTPSVSYLHSYLSRNWLHKLTTSRVNLLSKQITKLNSFYHLLAPNLTTKSTPSAKMNILRPLYVRACSTNSVYSKLFQTKKLIGDIFFFSRIASNPLLLKYLMYKTSSQFRDKTPLVTSLRSNLLTQLLKDAQSSLFGNRRLLNRHSNIQPVFNLQVALKRRVIYNLIQKTFMVNIVLLKYKMLIEIMEQFSSRKIHLKLSPSLEKSLTFGDTAQCRIWESRIYGFRRMLGPRIFVVEALRLVCLSLRLKDPTFLANWIRGMLKRLSFWKHRLIFRYLRYLIRYLFMNYFTELGFRGIKVQLKGKISVAGNARTRTLFFSYGETSQSTFDHKVAYDLSFVETFTGVMGFKLWFFY